MSANEIIAELPKLERVELEEINARVEALLTSNPGVPGKDPMAPIGKVLLEFAGRAEGLPSDFATNLDHYLYGIPKREDEIC